MTRSKNNVYGSKGHWTVGRSRSTCMFLGPVMVEVTMTFEPRNIRGELRIYIYLIWKFRERYEDIYKVC